MSSLDKGMIISRDLFTIAGHSESQLKTLNTYLCAFHMAEDYCDPDSLEIHVDDKRKDIRELQHQHALLEEENSRHRARIADLSARLSDAQAQAQVNVSSGDTAAQDTTSHEIVSAAEGQSSAQLLRSALPATISSGDFVQLVAMLSAEQVMSMGLNPSPAPLQNAATATIDAPNTSHSQ
jgi:multidrug resistance efflux pump